MAELQLEEACLDFLGLDPESIEELKPKILEQFEEDKALYF